MSLQKEMANKVIETTLEKPVRTLGGLDVAYDEESDELVAALSRFDYPSMQHVASHTSRGKTAFPYIPGLFSFRELPAVLPLFAEQDRALWPDVIICDGHGRIHPRRFGLACHLGVLLDWPVIGCAKNHLCGDWEVPAEPRGSWSPVVMDGETIGAALRTQDGVNPIFVSVGNRVTLEEAIEVVLKASPNYRLPETTRAADAAVRAALAKT